MASEHLELPTSPALAPGAAATEPVVQGPASWASLAGCLYGVPQPVMLGQIRIDPAAQIDLDELDRLIPQLAEDFHYVPPTDVGTRGLAARIASLTVTLLDYFAHPVAPNWYVGPLREDEGRHGFGIALPYYTLSCTRAVADWVIQTVSVLALNSPSAALQDTMRRSLEALRAKVVLQNPEANLYHFITAGRRLDAPMLRFTGPIVRFGSGRNSQLIDSTFTELTSAIGCNIARNKHSTATILREGGLPGPEHSIAKSVDEAVAAAEALGYPVVVKPADKDGGVGVHAGLQTADAVRAAAQEALGFTKYLLVERHYYGQDYRLTVHGGRVVKIEQRVAGGVTGNGRSTVAELITAKQGNPHFRRFLRTTGKMPLSLDGEAEQMLAEQHLTSDSVPDDGQVVVLRRRTNISTGGDQIGIAIDRAHRDNLELAIRAADLVYLDLAGVDLMIPDIAQSWLEVGGLICEVNARPQIDIQTSPDVYYDILRAVVGGTTRIPAHLFIIPDDKVLSGELIKALMGETGCSSLSTPQGVWVGGRKLATRPPGGFSAARTVLSEREADDALCVITSGEIIRRGLPIDRFDSIRIDAEVPDFQALANAVASHTKSLVRVNAGA